MSTVLESSYIIEDGFGELSQSSIGHARNELVKRVCDIVIGSVALLMLSPLLVVVAFLVKVTDFGPVLFVQTRIGRDGIPFCCLKFRSMKVNADRLKTQLMSDSHHQDARSFKIPKDPRVTWIGRIIRKYSIDEMPQLWNVIRGDMSLVGPRPSVPQEVAIYTPNDWIRLKVRPGLTCIWQVCGRGDIPFEKQLGMDIEYVENRSFLLDFKLLFLTIPAVLTARGAY